MKRMPTHGFPEQIKPELLVDWHSWGDELDRFAVRSVAEACRIVCERSGREVAP